MAAVATQAPKPKSDSPTSTLPERRQQFLNTVLNVLGGLNVTPDVLADRPQITVESQRISEICRVLKQDPRTSFKTLLCLAAVDYKESIQLLYILLSVEHEQTLAIKTDLDYKDPTIASVTTVWAAADWYEREAHDLFGVNFEGHPDLSPLLLYEGFEGFPGRKDFPFHEYDEF